MYLGLDFGTSYSVAATMDYDRPLVLLPSGVYGIPSVFYHSKDEEDIVGEDALGCGEGINRINMVLDVKTKLLKGDITLDDKTFSTREIVSKICAYTIEEALNTASERAIDPIIEGVVAAIPNKFGMGERNIIFSAVQKSVGEGIPILDIIKEPVAAAIYYFSLNCETDKYILVFDLGGGTCDISIVKSDSSIVEHYTVIDDDMLWLGGRNWDECLVEYIKNELNKKGIKTSDSDYETIRKAAINGKHKLSRENTEDVNIRVTIEGKVSPVNITRQKFDEITADLLKQTIDTTINLVNKHQDIKGKISEIICVGGSSKMLQVTEGLQNAFPNCKIIKSYPEHAVVSGLALYSEKLGEIRKKVEPGVSLDEEGAGLIDDIAPFSYGTYYNAYDKKDHSKKNSIYNFIIKGDNLPAEGCGDFSPDEDNMKFVDCDLYESDSNKKITDAGIGENFIGVIRLPLNPGTKAKEKISMNVKLNHLGFIEATACDEHGNRLKAEFVFNGSDWEEK